MTRQLPRVALAALIVLASEMPARADLFSPGDLARPHASLEGLKNCTKCHVAGEQLNPSACLDCHKELKPRVDAGKGFHGHIPAEKRDCEKCHHEHQGREFELVEWDGGKKAFDHAKSGFTLAGAHQKVDCEKCHENRRIADDGVRKLLLEQPKRTTFLGLGTSCVQCHFDEHRQQLGNDCQKCHTEKEWKPAPKFDHAKTEYALEGKHKAVSCEKCHPGQDDTTTAADAFPAPKNRAFQKFADVPHARCTDCHKDPHEDRFGQRCDSCHTPEDWHVIKGQGAERTFHDKTQFPLRGAHADVGCASCHGTPMKTKGIPFEHCSDCHADAHEGQFGKEFDCERCHTVDAFSPSTFDVSRHRQTAYPLEGKHVKVSCNLCHVEDRSLAEKIPASIRGDLKKKKRKELFSLIAFDLPKKQGCDSCHPDAHEGQLAANTACDRCHTVDGFAPARFEAEDHAKTRYKLDGAHRAVSCNLCHPDDPGLAARVPPAVHLAAKRGGHELVSMAVLHPAGSEKGCIGCHQDPHGGQFDARIKKQGCEACHTTTSFHETKFDHAKDSRFALTGKHREAACNACHLPEKQGNREVVRYKPLDTACASCHADVHAGQFAASAGATTDCARCHDTSDFHRLNGFQHAPPFASFQLTGKHAEVKCDSCHPKVTLARGVETRRYKPLPQDCESCHQDQHQGAFAGFEP